MYGYLLGLLFSAVIAGIAFYLVFAMFVGMSLSGSDNILPILIVIGTYLLATYILALLAHWIFNANQWRAFALNVSSVVFVISLVFLLNQINDFADKRKQAHRAQTAVADAPYIHLETPFIKKVQIPNEGVVILLQVPFSVTRTVRSQSLMFLTPILPERDIKFSSNPLCNSASGKPTYGFHIIDREFTEPPLPSQIRGAEIVS